MSAEDTHHRYSPSQADRFFACPGSVKACASVPPRPSNIYEQEGNDAHELAACAFREGERSAVTAWTEFSPFFMDEPNKDMCDAVQDYLDYVYDLIDEYGQCEMFVEVPVKVPNNNAPGEADGTADLVLWFPAIGWLINVDYKHGAGIAVDMWKREGKKPPILNRQTSQYTAGVLNTGIVPVDEIKKITMVIVQPRAFHASGPIREQEVNFLWLQDYLMELDEKIEECEQPDAPLVPGVEQCWGCDAAPGCPALETRALAVVRGDFHTVKDVAESKLIPPETLSTERLAYVMNAAPLLRKWLDQVKDYATEFARLGGNVPGFKIVEAQAKRRWHESDAAIALKLKALTQLTDDEIRPRKLITITDADKLVKKVYKSRVNGRKAKHKAAEEATQAMAFLTTKTSSGATSLVPYDDPRPAVSPEAAFNQVKVIGA